jgi:hypothetical protein
MRRGDEKWQGRELISLARKQMVPATDKKAQKGRDARTGARVSHGPEGGACIECIHSTRWCKWKGMEKGVRDGREQGKQGHEGGR